MCGGRGEGIKGNIHAIFSTCNKGQSSCNLLHMQYSPACATVPVVTGQQHHFFGYHLINCKQHAGCANWSANDLIQLAVKKKLLRLGRLVVSHWIKRTQSPSFVGAAKPMPWQAIVRRRRLGYAYPADEEPAGMSCTEAEGGTAARCQRLRPRRRRSFSAQRPLARRRRGPAPLPVRVRPESNAGTAAKTAMCRPAGLRSCASVWPRQDERPEIRFDAQASRTAKLSKPGGCTLIWVRSLPHGHGCAVAGAAAEAPNFKTLSVATASHDRDCRRLASPYASAGQYDSPRAGPLRQRALLSTRAPGGQADRVVLLPVRAAAGSSSGTRGYQAALGLQAWEGHLGGMMDDGDMLLIPTHILSKYDTKEAFKEAIDLAVQVVRLSPGSLSSRARAGPVKMMGRTRLVPFDRPSAKPEHRDQGML